MNKSVTRLVRWMLLAGVGASVVAQAQPPSTPKQPQGPWNPADSIVVAPLDPQCESGPDRALRMIQAVAGRCASTFAGNASDYAWIAAHLFAEFWVPLEGEVMLVEFQTKLTKDATVCLLTGFVEAGGGSPQARELAKAAIEEIRELVDRKKYWDKSTKAWNDLSRYGQDYLLTDNDHRKFLSYLDKKTFDRLKNTKKESNLIEKLLNFEDPTWKAKPLLQEARESLDRCELPQAAATLQAAQEIHLGWLRQVRETSAQLKKEIKCLREEHWRTQSSAPAGASLAHAQASDRFIELRDRAQFELERMHGIDLDEQRALRAGAELGASIENRSRIVDETLRRPFEQAAAAGAQAMGRCDFDGAQRSFDELKKYTRDPACASQLRDEYFRELKLQEDLQYRRGRRVENEAQVSRLTAEALALPATDCAGLEADASLLREATKGVCLDRAGADASVREIEARARACRGVQGPPTQQEMAPGGGNVLFTRGEPIVPRTDQNWPTVGHGLIRHTAYSGDALVTGTFTWTGPDVGIGAEGITVKITAACASTKLNGFATGISIEATGFKLLVDGKPVSGAVKAPVNCEPGESKDATVTVQVMPRERVSEGETAEISISPFWASPVRYVYTARGSR